MNVSESFALFTRLTIGDGLASQVPAFLISLAAALLVTRSTQQVNLPIEFLNQLVSRHKPWPWRVVFDSADLYSSAYGSAVDLGR